MYFPVMKGLIVKRAVGTIKAVDGVSFNIYKGETLGLVGESGCGKTTLGRTILRLYNPTSGQIEFNGKDFLSLKNEELRNMRHHMQMIFQNPYASLNPRFTIKQNIEEPLIAHNLFQKSQREDKVIELIKIVGLDPSHRERFPFELSGGQQQRVAIARALILNPSFIVCDEPVSSLDVSIQAQIINLLIRLREERLLTFLFIAHELAVVRHISDRIAVMYLGKIVELANKKEFYDNPLHPYTKALISAVSIPDPPKERKRKRILLEGEVPSPQNPPSGCRFSTRCQFVKDICREKEPLLRDISNGHLVACWMVGQNW